MSAHSIVVMDKVWNDQSLSHIELLQLQSDIHLLNWIDAKDSKMLAEWAIAQLLSVELNALNNIQSIQTGGQDELQL